jgi:hypothetical protein
MNPLKDKIWVGIRSWGRMHGGADKHKGPHFENSEQMYTQVRQRITILDIDKNLVIVPYHPLGTFV